MVRAKRQWKNGDMAPSTAHKGGGMETWQRAQQTVWWGQMGEMVSGEHNGPFLAW